MEFAIIVILIIATGFVSAMEMAFITVSKPRVKKLAAEGNQKAQLLLKLREKPERALSVLQVCITLLGGVSAALGGVESQHWVTPWLQIEWGLDATMASILAVIFIVVPLTYVTVMAELIPKNFALKYAFQIAMHGAWWLKFMEMLFLPIVNLLEKSTLSFLAIVRRFTPTASTQDQPPDTNVDLAALSDQNKQYVLNLLNIEHRTVKEIMVPWREVTRLESTSSIDDVSSTILASGHTRIPVCESSRILGLLHSKEFLAFKATGAPDWTSIVRPPLAVLESSPILNALKLMQIKRSHLAVVFSKDGSLQGIVTLEDIIEEVIGDLYDENDDGSLVKLMSAAVKEKARARI